LSVLVWEEEEMRGSFDVRRWRGEPGEVEEV
jgi:hypothetical protein